MYPGRGGAHNIAVNVQTIIFVNGIVKKFHVINSLCFVGIINIVN